MNDKQQKKTALYCRLSVDDGRLGESISIESQKILLVQYCKDSARIKIVHFKQTNDMSRKPSARNERSEWRALGFGA